MKLRTKTPRTLQLMMIGIWTWYQMKKRQKRQGFFNGSSPNLLSATVMEKISKNTTKPPVQCHIENYKNPENFSKIQPLVSFLLQPISTSQDIAENGGHCSLRGNDTTQGCNVVSESSTTITSNNAHDANKAFR